MFTLHEVWIVQSERCDSSVPTSPLEDSNHAERYVNLQLFLITKCVHNYLFEVLLLTVK